MYMNKQKISKIIAKKTSLYLKISMSLFVLSLILLTTAVIFVQQQYMQLRKDFVDNANTHIISVSRVQGDKPNITYPLSFEDKKNISDITKKYNGTSVFSEYVIPFGISDTNDETYFVEGIDNNFLEHSGMKKINDNEAIVSKELKAKKVTLKIPHINVEDGGFTSDYRTDLDLSFIPTTTVQKPFDEFDIKPDTIIVNTNTFEKIIETMYQVPWQEFQKNSIGENPYGIEMFNEINVYVDDLKNIKEVANQLRNTYEINYVLGAFEDLQSSLNQSYMIYALLLIFILIVTGINTIISFRGYLYSMQKDMGIFRHYGYSCSQVYNIYKSLIINPYIKIVGIGTIYSFVVSLILLKQDFIKPFILAFILIVFFVGIILISLLLILRKLSKKEIIILLKQSKEVE